MEFQIEARRTWDIRNTRCRGCLSSKAISIDTPELKNLKSCNRGDSSAVPPLVRTLILAV